MQRIKSLRFDDIKFKDFLSSRPSLTVIAGENGSGKSRALRALAEEMLRQHGRVIAVSSSPYHRFNGLGKGAKVLAPKRTGSSPESILKNAIRNAQVNDEIQLRSISRMLRHCNYSPEVGLKIKPTAKWAPPELRDRIKAAAAKRNRDPDDLESAIFLLRSVDAGQVEWLNFDGISFDFSKERNLSRLLFWEQELLDFGLIRPINLFLRGMHGEISLRNASSGELSLITSISFIATAVFEFDLVLVDEPENSLHPQWQRDYVDIISGAVGYARAKVVLATHSPVLVMGLESLDLSSEICVLSKIMHNSNYIDGDGLEDVMGKVFMTITPKNHFFSQKLVEILDRLEGKEIVLPNALDEIDELRAAGLDQQQRSAIELVTKMAHSIAEELV